MFGTIRIAVVNPFLVMLRVLLLDGFPCIQLCLIYINYKTNSTKYLDILKLIHKQEKEIQETVLIVANVSSCAVEVLKLTCKKK